MAKGLRCAGLEGFCVDLPLAAGFKPGKTFTQGIKSCLGAIDQLQLIEDIAHMDPHRALLDRKGAGYLLVRHALGNTLCCFPFSVQLAGKIFLYSADYTFGIIEVTIITYGVQLIAY
jgi:hypothetical protein